MQDPTEPQIRTSDRLETEQRREQAVPEESEPRVQAWPLKQKERTKPPQLRASALQLPSRAAGAQRVSPASINCIAR